jgi:hypothetical protein
LLVTNVAHANLADVRQSLGKVLFAAPNTRSKRPLEDRNTRQRLSPRDATLSIGKEGKFAVFYTDLVGRRFAFEEINSTNYLAVLELQSPRDRVL